MFIQKLNLMHLHIHKVILQLSRLVMSDRILIDFDVKIRKLLKIKNLEILPFGAPEHEELRRVLRTISEFQEECLASNHVQGRQKNIQYQKKLDVLMTAGIT